MLIRNIDHYLYTLKSISSIKSNIQSNIDPNRPDCVYLNKCHIKDLKYYAVRNK